MTTLPLGMMIEGLVAVLLLITIGYCWMLNRRLQRLRADEQVLRATISELMTATEIAERAILGLKTTAADANKTLGNRLKEAETMSSTLAEQIGEGDRVFTRISQIAEAARSAEPYREPVPQQHAYHTPPPVMNHAPQQGHYQQAPVAAQVNAAPPVEPERKRTTRASDIRSAAAEATARLEQFRKRKGAAA
ncbi:chemotaxis protein [Roseibium denhamense]|uniref:DUF6468 domain-containing protein n=1 Tax=Roseibium denhamense TaxID=76305 RepID=A0ABY1N8J4_9HYPH|nr:DUF6468 domain-containing protein [Roseibium denhamense]MTI05947.1 chemotaxis protein [Roseibium denhamense]SMP02923.1 hypothetical protein SAMN06265374_0492 [Roseibium denhamense]